MNDKELQDYIELLYPFFLKKLKSEDWFRACIKSTNATVTWVESDTNIGQMVKVILPFDTTEINVVNKSSADLQKDDLVCLHYNIDLKNAYVAYKV